MKKLFVCLVLGIFLLGNFSPTFANFTYDENIEMEMIGGEGGMRFSEPDANTLNVLGSKENYYKHSLNTAKKRIAIKNFKINSNNSVEGVRVYGMDINGANERILTEATIFGQLNMDGTIELNTTGKSRSFHIGTKEYTAWQEGICNHFNGGSTSIEGKIIDEKIKITLNQCVGGKGGTYFFSSTQPVDLVGCEEREVYLDEKCVSIDKLCSSDDLVNYDTVEKKCYCPVGYKLTDKKTCEEAQEMLFEVTYPEQQPPFLMDGKEYKIKVSVKNGYTNEPMKATKIAINYTTAPTQGEITNIEELGIGEYLLTYKPALIKGEDMNGKMDGLYIFYNSELENKELYKTYEIALGSGIPVKVSKKGFQDTVSAIVFAEKSAEVKVVTLNNAGEKIPVYDATVILDKQILGEETNKEGIVIMEAPKDINTQGEQEVVEIVLEPTAEVQERQNKALKQYKQIIQGDDPLASPEIRNFVENFGTYIAGLDQDEVERSLVGLKRVAYTLLYMTEGKNLITDISKNVAGSIKIQITDTLDLIGAAEKASEFLGSKMDSSEDTLKKLSPTISKKMESLGSLLEGKAINTIKLGIKKYAPNFKSEWVNGLISSVFGEYGKDDLIEKGVGEIQKISENKVEEVITSYLIEEFDSMLSKKMGELENMIKKGYFSVSGFEDDISISKLESLNLRDKYMTTHQISYNIGEIKDYADLINNTVVEGLKITQIYKAYAEGTEKGYKAIRSLLLNNADIYYWIDAYSKFISEVESNVNRGIGIAYLPVEQNILPKVYAEEIDMDFETRENASTYRGSDALIEIQNILLEINKLFLQVYPEDNNLLALQKELELNKVEEEKILEDLGPTAKNDMKNLLNELGEDTSSSIGEWVVLVLFIGIITGFVFFVRWIVRKVRKII